MARLKILREKAFVALGVRTVRVAELSLPHIGASVWELLESTGLVKVEMGGDDVLDVLQPVTDRRQLVAQQVISGERQVQEVDDLALPSPWWIVNRIRVEARREEDQSPALLAQEDRYGCRIGSEHGRLAAVPEPLRTRARTPSPC